MTSEKDYNQEDRDISDALGVLAFAGGRVEFCVQDLAQTLNIDGVNGLHGRTAGVLQLVEPIKIVMKIVGPPTWSTATADEVSDWCGRVKVAMDARNDFMHCRIMRMATADGIWKPVYAPIKPRKPQQFRKSSSVPHPSGFEPLSVPEIQSAGSVLEQIFDSGLNLTQRIAMPMPGGALLQGSPYLGLIPEARLSVLGREKWHYQMPPVPWTGINKDWQSAPDTQLPSC